MKSVRTSSKAPKRRAVSTSEGRKNLAAALRTVNKDKVLIAFGRYGKSVAVLAPPEAILTLAGRTVAPAVKSKIKALAAAMADGLEAERAAPPAKKKSARASR